MMRIHSLERLRKLGDVVRRRGPASAARLAAEAVIMEFDAEWIRRSRDRRFDAKHRVTTGGFLPLEELEGLTNEQVENSHNYRGTPVALFDEALRDLHLRHQEYEFVDYGSGMGKALLLAARYPFKRVTGVEFSQELHEAAERNIAGWRLHDQRCGDVRSVLADASTWPLPEGNCVLYFFNPFREALMRTVLASIVEQARAGGREIYILYVHPSFPGVFEEFSELRQVARVRLLKPLYDIYRIEPEVPVKIVGEESLPLSV
jgi:SAM-dependent methyltransferase